MVHWVDKEGDMRGTERTRADIISQKRARKTEEEFDAEWTKKYGPEAAALIRKAVDANMEDYLYLKQFAVKV
jgi:hypothetical protein